nr:hypothetical protein [Tanacetum cinerariifolium]
MIMFDVVESILLRCVAKDLLRWKSVCKSWWFMQGSCNGLVCIKNTGHAPRVFVINPMTGELRELQELPVRIFVINPVTREFRELQQPPVWSNRVDWRCFGFGYDSSTDDYKVVMAICQQDGDHALVHILSLKSNIWKLFGQVNYRFDLGQLIRPAKEEFREIPQPDDTRYVWNYGYRLGIIQGRLCIFPAFKERVYPSCGIWVMRSYNSWELIPKDREIEDDAIHYMLKDTDEYRITPPPSYFCDENIHLSRSKEHIPSPMFVKTLVSPYVNNGGPSHT